MSILRDLDPANARLSSLPPPRSGRAAVWIIALLLIIAGTAWLLLTQGQERQNWVIESSQPPHQEKLARALELAQQPPETAPPPVLEQSPPPRPDKGAALIREGTYATDDTIDSNKTSLNLQDFRQGQDSGLKAEPSGKKGLAIAPQKKSSENRPSNAVATKKQGKKPGAQAATDGSRPHSNVKKAAERDVDIITAIVR